MELTLVTPDRDLSLPSIHLRVEFVAPGPHCRFFCQTASGPRFPGLALQRCAGMFAPNQATCSYGLRRGMV